MLFQHQQTVKHRSGGKSWEMENTRDALHPPTPTGDFILCGAKNFGFQPLWILDQNFCHQAKKRKSQIREKAQNWVKEIILTAVIIARTPFDGVDIICWLMVIVDIDVLKSQWRCCKRMWMTDERPGEKFGRALPVNFCPKRSHRLSNGGVVLGLQRNLIALLKCQRAFSEPFEISRAQGLGSTWVLMTYEWWLCWWLTTDDCVDDSWLTIVLRTDDCVDNSADSWLGKSVKSVTTYDQRGTVLKCA